MFYILIVMTFVLLLLYANQNTKKAVFTRIKLPINDSSWNGELRVLHLSDLHMENLSITPEQLLARLKSEDIELIALTGDYLDRARSIPKFLSYIDILNTLNCKYGIYVVFGNHDYVLNANDFEYMKQSLEHRGCHVLINDNKQICVNGQKVNIIGIDDHSTKRSDTKKAYKGIEDGVNLVLTHDPNIVLGMREYHYDYLLSGHFHGGQIHYPKAYHLIKMGALPKMNMVKGLHFHDAKAFYISEGLGQTGFNIRLRSRPEITLHTLIAKD